MKQQNKEVILALLLLLLLILFIFMGLDSSAKDNNWWTRALCYNNEGEYQERPLYDVCIINETECQAKLISTRKYWNNLTTHSHEVKGWKLKC